MPSCIANDSHLSKHITIIFSIQYVALKTFFISLWVSCCLFILLIRSPRLHSDISEAHDFLWMAIYCHSTKTNTKNPKMITSTLQQRYFWYGACFTMQLSTYRYHVTIFCDGLIWSVSETNIAKANKCNSVDRNDNSHQQWTPANRCVHSCSYTYHVQVW